MSARFEQRGDGKPRVPDGVRGSTPATTDPMEPARPLRLDPTRRRTGRRETGRRELRSAVRSSSRRSCRSALPGTDPTIPRNPGSVRRCSRTGERNVPDPSAIHRIPIPTAEPHHAIRPGGNHPRIGLERMSRERTPGRPSRRGSTTHPRVESDGPGWKLRFRSQGSTKAIRQCGQFLYSFDGRGG